MIKEISTVAEEYLQAILVLSEEEKALKSISLVNWLKSSPPTVHSTLSRLKRDKLVQINPKKVITLTKDGRKQAEAVARRHRLAEIFLCNTLGISWHEVHKHAHVLEHGLTPLVEEKLAEFLGYPKFCPHGTPFPGESHALPPSTKSLDSFKPGDRVEILVISEVLEESLGLMKFLQDNHIIPRKQHEIEEKTDITKTMVLKADTGAVTLTYEIASRISAVKV